MFSFSSRTGLAAGFTLVEVVVTLAIMGILTVAIAVAFPTLRSEQKLLLAQQRLEALLRDAGQRALNEDRDSACVDRYPGDDSAAATKRRRCSDVGVAVTDQSALLFADIDGNKSYSASQDYVIEAAETLPATVHPTYYFVAIGTPPQLELYGNGALLDDQHPATLTLTVGRATRRLGISSFGKVQQR